MGVPFPSPEGLPNPGIEPRSPALQADSVPPEPPGKRPYVNMCVCVCVYVFIYMIQYKFCYRAMFIVRILNRYGMN